MTDKIAVAILYQASKPPVKDGIVKPMKPGGYADSGADIGYCLLHSNIAVITPETHPSVDVDLDWVFPDTTQGIELALSKGATVFWLNTVLYSGHPIESFIEKGIMVVGQTPENVDLYDDKWTTNNLLRQRNLPTPQSILVTTENLKAFELNFPFPVVTKPIRGRGSEGVTLVSSQSELSEILNAMFATENYGAALYVEEYLSGQELTITIMPPGNYSINNSTKHYANYWCLPPVKRFNHQNGIAPYNGTVAVINNSAVLSSEELATPKIQTLCKQCETAAELVNAKAPIRIDCRANTEGNYFLFDLNMKPNMTGASRPQRGDQDSLTALAARQIGWTYADLLLNMLQQRWTKASR